MGRGNLLLKAGEAVLVAGGALLKDPLGINYYYYYGFCVCYKVEVGTNI